jgi:hypothetical protein
MERGDSFILKTPSQQRLEWLMEQRRHRRLTDEEWQQVARAEHAIAQLERKRQRLECE